MTLDQANSDAINDAAEVDPRTRRLAELEARGVKFSTFLFWENPEGCPPPLPKCTDCGGRMVLWHRDVIKPSPRCSGLINEAMKWKDCRCQDDILPEFFVNPNMPQPDPDESEPDI